MIKRHVSEFTTLSWLGLLPRILPPCQIFEPSGRSSELPTQSVVVAHTFKELPLNTVLNHIPDKIHNVSALKSYQMKVFRINFRASPAKSTRTGEGNLEPGIEMNSIPLQPTRSETCQNHIATRRTSNRKLSSQLWHRFHNHLVTAASLSPEVFVSLNYLALGSLLLTIGLVAWSILVNDGMALLAVILMSLASSMVGLASKWSSTFGASVLGPGALGHFEAWLERVLSFPIRSINTGTKGSVIIYTPSKHAFIVVHCTMNVAMALYSFEANSKYYSVHGKQSYRVLRGLSALLLTFSLILLASSSWTMQIAVGSTYVLLTVVWQIPTVTSSDKQSILAHFEAEQEYPPGLDLADEEKPENADTEKMPRFARTLWYAIRATQETEWVIRSGIVPQKSGWELWLNEAQINIDQPLWPAVASCLHLTTRAERLLFCFSTMDLEDGDPDFTNPTDIEPSSLPKQAPQSQSQGQRTGSLEIESIPSW